MLIITSRNCHSSSITPNNADLSTERVVCSQKLQVLQDTWVIQQSLLASRSCKTKMIIYSAWICKGPNTLQKFSLIKRWPGWIFINININIRYEPNVTVVTTKCVLKRSTEYPYVLCAGISAMDTIQILKIEKNCKYS